LTVFWAFLDKGIPKTRKQLFPSKNPSGLIKNDMAVFPPPPFFSSPFDFFARFFIAFLSASQQGELKVI
jgi:hypothetical protein